MLKKMSIAGCLFFLSCASAAYATPTNYTLGLESTEVRDAGQWTTNLEWEESGVPMELFGTFKQIDDGYGRTGVLLYPGSLFVYLGSVDLLTSNPIMVEVDVFGGITAELHSSSSATLMSESNNTGDMETLSFNLTQPGAQFLHIYSNYSNTDWVDEIRLVANPALGGVTSPTPVPEPATLLLLGSGLIGGLSFRKRR